MQYFPMIRHHLQASTWNFRNIGDYRLEILAIRQRWLKSWSFLNNLLSWRDSRIKYNSLPASCKLRPSWSSLEHWYNLGLSRFKTENFLAVNHLWTIFTSLKEIQSSHWFDTLPSEIQYQLWIVHLTMIKCWTTTLLDFAALPPL